MKCSVNRMEHVAECEINGGVLRIQLERHILRRSGNDREREK